MHVPWWAREGHVQVRGDLSGVLSFHHVGPGNWTQDIRLGARDFTQWQSPAPIYKQSERLSSGLKQMASSAVVSEQSRCRHRACHALSQSFLSLLPSLTTGWLACRVDSLALRPLLLLQWPGNRPMLWCLIPSGHHASVPSAHTLSLCSTLIMTFISKREMLPSQLFL